MRVHLVHVHSEPRSFVNAMMRGAFVLKGVRAVLGALPAAAHPMDVMRTAVSALGCAMPDRAFVPVGGRA